MFTIAALALASACPGSTAGDPPGLIPIEICLTFGVSEDICVLFTDDDGGGWGIMDIDIFELMEDGLEPGDQIHVSGEYCTSCIHTFCGAFSGFIFHSTISDCEPPSPSFPADINIDGRVDGVDLSILLGNWGLRLEAGHGCNGIQPCQGDINGDQTINGLDLAILLAQWTG